MGSRAPGAARLRSAVGLAATNLSVGFAGRGGGGQRAVLRGVGATFNPGRVCAVLGPNGSGKTTLLRTLLGLVEPASGDVTLDGRRVGEMTPSQRARRIGYVPQKPSLAAPISVRQYVSLGRYAAAPAHPGRRQLDEAAVARAIADVDLRDRVDDRVDELSAGLAQRATLARVLAQLDVPEALAGSRVVLADEPTAALDPRHALATMHLLRAQASAGLVVVVVVHDATLALRHADDVLLLDADGAVSAHGPTDSTLTPAALERVFSVPFVRIDGEARAVVPAGAGRAD